MAQIQWCLVIAHCNQDVECTQDILQYPAPGNHQDLRQHSLPLHNGARPLTSSPDPSGHREAQTHLTHTVQDASTIAYKIILHRPPTQLPTAMPTTAHIYAKGRPRGWGRGTPESFTLVLTECEIHRSRCWLHSRRPRGTHNRGGAERVGGGCGKPIHFKQGTHTNWAGAGCSAARLRLPEAPLRVSQVRAEIQSTPRGGFVWILPRSPVVSRCSRNPLRRELGHSCHRTTVSPGADSSNHLPGSQCSSGTRHTTHSLGGVIPSTRSRPRRGGNPSLMMLLRDAPPPGRRPRRRTSPDLAEPLPARRHRRAPSDAAGARRYRAGCLVRRGGPEPRRVADAREPPARRGGPGQPAEPRWLLPRGGRRAPCGAAGRDLVSSLTAIADLDGLLSDRGNRSDDGAHHGRRAPRRPRASSPRPSGRCFGTPTPWPECAGRRGASPAAIEEAAALGEPGPGHLAHGREDVPLGRSPDPEGRARRGGSLARRTVTRCVSPTRIGLTPSAGPPAISRLSVPAPTHVSVPRWRGSRPRWPCGPSCAAPRGPAARQRASPSLAADHDPARASRPCR